MSTIDKAALIEQATQIILNESHGTRLGSVEALLAPLRELHHTVVAYSDFAMTTGRRECVCGRSDCPTVRLLDAIELEVQP